MFPVPFILLAFRKILRFLSQSARWQFVDRLTARSLRKGKQVQKYGLWGLVAFVGTPCRAQAFGPVVLSRFCWGFL